MATGEVIVSLEKVVHDSMREVAQEIFDKHGICLRTISFSWIDVSTHEKSSFHVADVVAETLTKV